MKNLPTQVKKLFSKEKIEEKVNHTRASNYRKKIIPRIRKELGDVAERTDIDSALLFEYSNGTSNLVGLPFLYATATAEVVKNKISQMSHLFQKMNVSLFADFIENLEDRSYFYFKEPEELKYNYPIMYNYLSKTNIKSGLFYALYDDDDSVGFIAVFSIKKTFERQDILPKIAEVAQYVSALLNYDKIKNELQ